MCYTGNQPKTRLSDYRKGEDILQHVGILGGTFDPPHIGHLIIAEAVRQDLALEEVWFIPSYEPPHKQKAHSSAAHRIKMVNLATRGNSFFTMDPIETKRYAPSFTVDTLEELTEQNPNTHFYFIIGADMVAYLSHWKRIDRLLELVTFVGVKRSGYSLQTTYPIEEVEVPMISVSSSMLRQQIREQRSIMYFVPEPVRQYIKEHHLYG